MSELDLLLLVRLVHVVAGTFWTGAAILVAAFLMPAIKAAGAAGTPVMRELTVVRKLPQVLLVTAGVAIASGAYLYWIASGGLRAAWVYSWSGAVYTLGGLAAVLAFLVGISINIPTANRMGALAVALRASGDPPPAEQSRQLGRLALRLALATRAVAALVVIATAAIALARYLS